MSVLQEAGVPAENIYFDKYIQDSRKRPEYAKLLSKMQTGDVLCIKSLEALSQSYAEILEQWRFLVREKKIDILVLDMPLLDTRRSDGDSLSDVVMQVLSFVVEHERILHHQRQVEGIAAAKARGTRFGRVPKPLPENFYAAYRRWKRGEITGTAAAEACDMPLSTFRYRAEIYEKTVDRESFDNRGKSCCRFTK